jgi:hypothetical protein
MRALTGYALTLLLAGPHEASSRYGSVLDASTAWGGSPWRSDAGFLSL